jgi:3-dehydroquinate dehydratase-2
MSRILVLNGPNLNLLGRREPGIYGEISLESILADLQQRSSDLGIELSHLQSNAEHELIDAIHKAGDVGQEFIIFNPGGYTHSSVALRDALLGVGLPFIEVHLSNIHAREAFREHSYFSDIAEGVISGLGPIGYRLALEAAAEALADGNRG